MRGERHDEQFADYLAGRMTPEEIQQFEQIMDEDDRSAVDIWRRLGSLPTLAPSFEVRNRFERMLSNASHSGMRWRPWAIAAAVFIGGFIAGRGIPAMGPSQPPTEVATLREEVRGLREAVIVSMLRQQSASDRLKGVLTSATLSRPDGDVVNALIETLRRDPNVNVRLAAVDALKRFSGDETVRNSMANALTASDSPLVQIALINAVVEMEDHGAANALRELQSASEVNQVVKERAKLALERLNSPIQ